MGTRPTSNRSGRGFTLIEILIVVVILGILAAVIIPHFTNAASDVDSNGAQNQWDDLIDAAMMRSSPTWPANFTESYNAGTGAFSLTLGSPYYDVNGDGTADSGDATAVAAW